MIAPRFRQDYDGEFVIIETKKANGRTTQIREWIENPIQNQHISGRAAVVGSRNMQHRFRHQCLEHHQGGLLAKKSLQTYGVNDLWTDMEFDFFVAADVENTQRIVEAKYDESCIVYTTSKLCLNNPGHFYIVPYQPSMDSLATALYLAAFDGHKEIFMIGYDNDTPALKSSWKEDITEVINVYGSAQFYLVGVQSNMPDSWRKQRNVSCMDFRQFISYCDV